MAHVVFFVARALLALLLPVVQFGCCNSSNSRIVSLDPSQHKEMNMASKRIITEAIRISTFLNMLDFSQIGILLKRMTLSEVAQYHIVIIQGNPADYIYISEEGKFSIICEGIVEEVVGSGRAFGVEGTILSTLYKETVQAVTDAKLWRIPRKDLTDIILMKDKLLKESVKTLQKIRVLSQLPVGVLRKMVHDLKVRYYLPQELIIQAGLVGDALFFLLEGTVGVKRNTEFAKGVWGAKNVPYKRFTSGSYFGEIALLKTKCRTASVMAEKQGAQVLILSRHDLKKYRKHLEEHFIYPPFENYTLLTCNETMGIM